MVGDDDPIYKGGSYLFVQKYIHDLNAFEKLPTDEQEKVIGRYKMNDIEMPDNIKPSNSHVALANVGDDFKVIRDNMPFGNLNFQPGLKLNNINLECVYINYFPS